MLALPGVTWSVAITSPSSSSTLRAWHAFRSGNGQCRCPRRAGQLHRPLAAGGGVAPCSLTALQLTASYTFSKTIDEGSGAFAAEQIYQSLRLDRVLADTDVRNRFVFSGVYELPLGHGKRFGNSLSKPLEMVVGGWQLNTIVTVQSGLPFTLTTPGSPSNARPDLIGKLDTHPGNTWRYFNTNAVAVAPTNSSASCFGKERWD